ncbi:MAG: hypothetical protein M1376_09120 [Planctomycetes bacterium]|nr:hypothetical protein [Planctomycetota bacterium]
MRTQKRKIAFFVLAVLTGGAVCAGANVAATVDPAAIGSLDPTGAQSIGWRFFVDQEITITHLGVYDAGDDGLAGGPYTLGIWRVKKAGGLQLEKQVSIGPGGTTENHHVYVALDTPFTIVPDPVPYVDPATHIAYYERWLVGVWSPSGDLDRFAIYPFNAATLDIVNAGIIRFQNYTYRISVIFDSPWTSTSERDHFGVNFKYTLPGPTAEAGPDVSIYTSEQALTTIVGVGGHTYPTTPIQYRWLEGTTVLQDWQDVGLFGTASLSLAAPVATLAIGAHTLTLEVTDGGRTASDTMVLTLDNTPPAAVPVTGHVLEIGADAILIQGSVADFDGDTVTYRWLKDGQELETGSLDTQAGGGEVALPDLVIPAGDPRFPLGVNQIQLEVSDGVNPAESGVATVEIIDTTAPTVTPTASALMLWPPNHQLIPITIWVNGQDNSGGTLHLAANVTCSEDDGETDVDWYIDDVSDAAGTIALRLRAERPGTGEGRGYNIAITAIDTSNNQSSVATMEIRVPHDKRKK